jgi:hypothetical protein
MGSSGIGASARRSIGVIWPGLGSLAGAVNGCAVMRDPCAGPVGNGAGACAGQAEVARVIQGAGDDAQRADKAPQNMA